MSIFDFKDTEVNPSELHPKSIGTVQSVDNGKVFIQITSSEKLQLLRIGSLVAIPAGLNRYIIGLVNRIWRERSKEKVEDEVIEEEFVVPENNGALLLIVGSLLDKEENPKFSRTLDTLPGINEEIFLLQDDNLHEFMNVVSQASVAAQEKPLDFGVYSLDLNSSAYLDGNKLFQRHASLLGSTGSGKSWTVARILEQANKLDAANVILFDLHGEYSNLSYANHYKIAGPSDLDKPDDHIMFLPYWLLSFEEIQALFVEQSEFTAHNQVLIIHDTIKDLKREFIEKNGKEELLESFTIDTPVPYKLDDLLGKIEYLNTEMVPGKRGKKQGDFYGNFSRLLARLNSKINDKKYGFLYQLPSEWNNYETLSRIASKLLGTNTENDESGIKVLNLSEVPSDVLPVVVGTLAKLIYNLQFWTSSENRHPLLLACDEAHLYLPKVERANPIERSAVENVERIAKEGRKYGVGLMVISQRPSDVSDTILSQCNNIISLRLTNPTDQNTVRKLLPDTLGDMMQILPLMDIGEAIVVGDAVLLPTRIKVLPPEEEPMSSTIQFWDEWGNEVKRDATFFSELTENLRFQRRKN